MSRKNNQTQGTSNNNRSRKRHSDHHEQKSCARQSPPRQSVDFGTFDDFNKKEDTLMTTATHSLKSLHEHFHQFLRQLFNSDQSAKDNEEDSIQNHEGQERKRNDSDYQKESSIDSVEHPKGSTTGASNNVVSSSESERDEDQRKRVKELSSSNLPFNVKGKEAVKCQCSSGYTNQWVIHGQFEGEKVIPRCCLNSNNADKLWHYQLSVSPTINFETKRPTIVEYKDEAYVFEGFSLLSHYRLDQIPPCTFIHYNREYTVNLSREEIPKNFCIKDLDLFQEYVFEKLLEIYDWNIQGEDGCQLFHFFPRFVCRADSSPQRKHCNSRDAKLCRKDVDTDQETEQCRQSYQEATIDRDSEDSRRSYQELLPMNVVLEYLLKSFQPIVESDSRQWSRDEWKSYERQLCDSLVVSPEKKPSCIRLDGLGINKAERRSKDESKSKQRCPSIIHISSRPARMNYMSDKRYLKLKQEKRNLKMLLEGRNASRKSDVDRLRKIEAEIKSIKAECDLKKSFKIEIPAKEMHKTGLKTDITQHLVYLHFLVDHIRYHKSLEELEKRIDYRFENRNLLQTALRHSSASPDTSCSTHIRVTELNCGIYKPSFGTDDPYRQYKKEKGINNLSKVMMKLPEPKECFSNLKHNESLEFLGDAVLEFITSRHLFFLFGELSEGSLNTFRSSLVQNKNLSEIAKRLGLEHFMHFGHGLDSLQSKLDHILGNCVEAILGAVYLDGGYEEAENLVCSLLFPEQDLREIWRNIPKHELQIKEPNGDRHLISKYEFLQKFVELEEQIGVEFSHICLLARAFKHPSSSYSNVIGGSNQRLEYFGDSILKMIISDYLYKHFPGHQEGHLTLLRTSLINGKIQATVAEELGLQNYLIFQNEKNESGATHVKRLADTFEAFLAAVYVDKGLEYCRTICDVCFIPKLEDFILNQRWIDPKSYLQQCCSFRRDDFNRKENPFYRLLESTGPVQNKTFRAAVYFKCKRIGTGIANTIQGAEMAAAEDALQSNYFGQIERQKRGVSKIYEHLRTRNTEESIANPSHPGPQTDSPQWIYLDG